MKSQVAAKCVASPIGSACNLQCLDGVRVILADDARRCQHPSDFYRWCASALDVLPTLGPAAFSPTAFASLVELTCNLI